MKSKYSQTKRIETRRTKKKKGNKSRNIMLFLAIITCILSYFLEWSWTKLLLILMAELISVFVATFLLSNYSTVKKSNKKENTVIQKSATPQLSYDYNIQKNENKSSSIKMSRRQQTSKVVKLEKKNYDWLVSETGNKPKSLEKSAKEEVAVKRAIDTGVKKITPYRSPFDPIHPPKKEVEVIQNIPETLVIEKPQDTIVIEELENMKADLEIPEEENECSEISPIDNTSFKDEDKDTVLDETKVDEAFNEKIEEDESENFEDDSFLDEIIYAQNENTLELEAHADEEKEDVLEDVQAEQEESQCETEIKSEPVFVMTPPPLELLNRSEVIEESEGEALSHAEYNAKKLVETLASFGVGAKLINISEGPAVTRYELQPNVGVKVSKIVSLSDDIALNLAATGVRIEAPIPGKAAVGIEVPNKVVTPVFLGEVIESEEFKNHSSKLAFAVGKDIAGNVVIADIAKMPHLLIAGATGSGKSVCINTLIASILYKSSPAEVKLLMVDPKVVELGIYNGIPHLLIPVVTDPKKAAGALNWAVQEMTSRYKLFADNSVRDLKGYNTLITEKGGAEPLPQIVIIIDELADLMMVAPNDVEDSICRLAQMARAAGMHLVIATQRPSVDVITGVIKANIPSRISFAVSSQIDSRTILDMAGAEKLLGRGDMLFNPIGEPKPKRVQGGYISDKEVEALVAYLKSEATAVYDEEIIKKIEKQTEAPQAESNDGDDELLPQAIEMVLELGQASTSLIQRKFKVGYSRAARIVDQMESWGIVGGSEGSKPRQVLVTKQEWYELNT